jgi:hypothetical protein
MVDQPQNQQAWHHDLEDLQKTFHDRLLSQKSFVFISNG